MWKAFVLCSILVEAWYACESANSGLKFVQFLCFVIKLICEQTQITFILHFSSKYFCDKRRYLEKYLSFMQSSVCKIFYNVTWQGLFFGTFWINTYFSLIFTANEIGDQVGPSLYEVFKVRCFIFLLYLYNERQILLQWLLLCENYSRISIYRRSPVLYHTNVIKSQQIHIW